MPQVKITFDGGIVLEDDENTSALPYAEVGTFRPVVNISIDGRVARALGGQELTGRQIEMRLVNSAERDNAAVTLSSELLERHLLRLPELYGDVPQFGDSRFVPIDIDAFDCIFRLDIGHIRSSRVEDHVFMEVDHETGRMTGRWRLIPQITHDLVVEFELWGQEALEILDAGRVLWSSGQRLIEGSLEIEVLADNSTAESYYRKALKLSANQNYWLPNQGDLPPASPYRGQSRRLDRLSRENVHAMTLAISSQIRDTIMFSDILVNTSQKKSLEPETKKAPGPEKSATVDRYVNLWFTSQRADEPRLSVNQSLVKNRAAYLRLNIAQFDSRSILQEARPFISQEEIERAFPETKGKPVPLEVTLFSSDFEIPAAERTKKLKLVQGRATETVYFKVTSVKLGEARLRVCIFYKNHLLQSIGVEVSTLERATRQAKLQRARVETTYTADFTRVAELPARGLWLGLNESPDGTHALNVKGTGKAFNRNLEDQIVNALNQARSSLLKVSFDIEKDDDGREVIDDRTKLPKKIYRFDNKNFPRASGEPWQIKRFKEDLTALAAVGNRLFDAVFGAGFTPVAEQSHLVSIADDLKKLLRNPQVIQVTRLKRLADIWPWALMYDSPIDLDRVKEVCLAFRGENGRALPPSEGLKKCTHGKDKTVVCPYGFWGFRHIIEQPTWPGGDAAFANLILQIKIPAQPVFAMPLASELQSIEPAHVQGMKDINFKFLNSFAEIEKALNSENEPPPLNPHILYFFCHGKYDSYQNPYLQVGTDDALRPADLEEWALKWDDSHGLVFINGCHTVDLSPKDLSAIMSPFVKAHASGIIGTEITVHTFLAREFAQGFFKLLLPNGNPGQKVGTIIRDLRLELLMKYNPLGLVYTPYCSADLQFSR